MNCEGLLYRNEVQPPYDGSQQRSQASRWHNHVKYEQARTTRTDFLSVNNTIPNNFTVAAWIKTTDNGGGWGPAYGGRGIIWSDIPGGANDMIPMSVTLGHLAFGTGENWCTGYDTLTSAVPVDTGTWIHVAVTRDTSNGQKQIYINGVLNAVNYSGGCGPLSANGIIAFGSNVGDYRYFFGQLQDVYFYDRVLSATEIHSLLSPGDTTQPVISGMPVNCSIWPPNNKLVQVATVTASDDTQVASFNVTGTSNEPFDPQNPDIVISSTGLQRTVQLRAARLGSGSGRMYTLTAVATDTSGNTATSIATCTVPHDQR